MTENWINVNHFKVEQRTHSQQKEKLLDASFEWHWQIDWIKENGLNQWYKESWIKAEAAFKKQKPTR